MKLDTLISIMYSWFNQSHTAYISHHITPQVINALGNRNKHTHTYRCINKNDFKKPGVHGHRPCMPGLKKFYKNLLLLYPFVYYQDFVFGRSSFLSLPHISVLMDSVILFTIKHYT